MCKYETLYYDSRVGYVIRCTECEKIQVAWQNLVMTFREDEFDIFRAGVGKLREEQLELTDRSARIIRVPAPCAGIQLLLSAEELDEWATLLESADSERKSLALIGLFKK